MTGSSRPKQWMLRNLSRASPIAMSEVALPFTQTERPGSWQLPGPTTFALPTRGDTPKTGIAACTVIDRASLC